jgi:hypothetical protein
MRSKDEGKLQREPLLRELEKFSEGTVADKVDVRPAHARTRSRTR